MNILQVSSEVFPYSKTGGLGDAIASLAKAQAETGHHVTIATPLYKGIHEKFKYLEPSGIENTALQHNPKTATRTESENATCSTIQGRPQGVKPAARSKDGHEVHEPQVCE